MTTAACEIQGKPDDCHELNVLRRVRDELYHKWPMRCLIKRYYRQAPDKANKLRIHPDRDRIVAEMFDTYIPKVITALNKGSTVRAVLVYIAMSRFVAREVEK